MSNDSTCNINKIDQSIDPSIFAVLSHQFSIISIHIMGEPSAFPVFKKATLEDNSIGNKKRAWKSLKQILAIERTLQWPDNAITCELI